VSLIRLSGRVVVAQFSVACGMILNKNFATLKFRFGASTLLGARNECFCSVVFRLFTISFIFLVERDCPVVHLFAFVCFHSRFLALPRGMVACGAGIARVVTSCKCHGEMGACVGVRLCVP